MFALARNCLNSAFLALLVCSTSCVHRRESGRTLCPDTKSAAGSGWGAYEQSVYRARLLKRTNALRRQFGLKSLHASNLLNEAALRQSEMFRTQNSISHRGFPVERQRLLRRLEPQSRLSVRSENLARVKSCLRQPELLADTLFALWMQSPSHRKALLGPYRLQGAATIRQQDWHYASVFFY